ncbi:MAG: hypothetical protein AAF483_06865 [Planctomycetota bacterium]
MTWLRGAAINVDWIDPNVTTSDPEPRLSGTVRGESEKAQTEAERDARPTPQFLTASLDFPNLLAHYQQALKSLDWPQGSSLKKSFHWSALTASQTEILARVGFSATKDSNKKLSKGDVLNKADFSKVAHAWLTEVEESPVAALGVVALVWQLPTLQHENWVATWIQALTDRIVASDIKLEEIFIRLTLHCEIPLLLTWLNHAPTAQQANDFMDQMPAKQAMDDLAEYLEMAVDDPSSWLQDGASFLRASLASVLRCRILADALGLNDWFSPQKKALRSLLIQAARWCRPDGTQLLADTQSAPRSQAIWDALADAAQNSKKLKATMALAGVGQESRASTKADFPADKLPALCQHSEFAACAVFQSDWKRKGCHMALDFSKSNMRIEVLGAKGLPILSGSWDISAKVRGRNLTQAGQWQESCWFSDDDVDYLEFEVRFGNQFRVQRQLILFREDRLLYLADSLNADRESSLALSSSIPLATHTQFAPEQKSTEGYLIGPSHQGLVLPLFLPEWRQQLTINGSKDKIANTDGMLVAHSEARARRLYNPVVISLRNSHAEKNYTWRHLTVADQLRIVEKEEAQAFRFQIGSEQWFVYRNLDRPIRRTALSFHLLDDFYAGRFDAEDGELDAIVQVEAPN